MVLSLNPCAREGPKAASRSGPTFPVVPASASVWHEPHLLTKSSFPPPTLEFRSTPPVPHPAVTRTAPRIAAAAAAEAGLGRGFFRVKPLEGLGAGRVDREHAVEAGDLEDLRNVAIAADDREPAALLAQPLDPADQHA